MTSYNILMTSSILKPVYVLRPSLQNTRHKTYGFDILTENDKVFYPLAADGETELGEWTSVLQKAIAGEVEESDGPSRLRQLDWFVGLE